MRVALVVYDGVLSAECDAFRSVLGLLSNSDVSTVGARTGTFAGPGGQQQVDQTFDEIVDVDVVIVPGGLGCERAADDPELRDFLRRMEHIARYVVSSSTGSVVLASAGLLHGQPAATHWLASDLLRRYGSDSDTRRLVLTGKVMTCEGQISAVDAAFALVERLEGVAAVAEARATLIERGQPHLHPPTRRDRARTRLFDVVGVADRPTSSRQPRSSGPPPDRAAIPAGPPPITPLSVMIELVDNDDIVRRLKRSNRRRPRRR